MFIGSLIICKMAVSCIVKVCLILYIKCINTFKSYACDKYDEHVFNVVFATLTFIFMYFSVADEGNISNKRKDQADY